MPAFQAAIGRREPALRSVADGVSGSTKFQQSDSKGLLVGLWLLEFGISNFTRGLAFFVVSPYNPRFPSRAVFFKRFAAMPKLKTHKGMKKRFTVTASGKAKHRSAFRGHILSSKSPKTQAASAAGQCAHGCQCTDGPRRPGSQSVIPV